MRKQTEKEFFDEDYTSKGRLSVGQVYSITGRRYKKYEELIYQGVEGLNVLEYGCGTGSHSIEMARRGAHVVGIDISEVGISQATERAAAEGLANAEYIVMDAEEMTFPENTFDLVIGEGILHHLDLEKSYQEISRVLKPSGRAVFSEPLGHNPAIVLFRALTPKLRTPDEHPLLWRDFKMAEKYFSKPYFLYYHMMSLASLVFVKTPLFFPTVSFLDKIDAALFKVIPPLRMLAWYSIMVLERPISK